MSASIVTALLVPLLTACGCCIASPLAVGCPQSGHGATAAPWPKIGGDIRNSSAAPSCRVRGRTAWTVQLSAPIRGSAVVDGDETVYAVCQDGAVYAFDGRTAREVWRKELGGRPAGAPAIAPNGVLVVACAGAVYGLDLTDGAERWRWDSDAQVRGPVGLGADGAVFVGTAKPAMVCLDGGTGRRRWASETGLNAGACASVSVQSVFFADRTDRDRCAPQGRRAALAQIPQ